MFINRKLRSELCVKVFFWGGGEKLPLAKCSMIASALYAIPIEFPPPFTLSKNFMVISEKLQPESCVKGFGGAGKKLPLAKRSMIASIPYAITSEI